MTGSVSFRQAPLAELVEFTQQKQFLSTDLWVGGWGSEQGGEGPQPAGHSSAVVSVGCSHRAEPWPRSLRAEGHKMLRPCRSCGAAAPGVPEQGGSAAASSARALAEPPCPQRCLSGWRC